jgi:hypothetical protein
MLVPLLHRNGKRPPAAWVNAPASSEPFLRARRRADRLPEHAVRRGPPTKAMCVVPL